MFSLEGFDYPEAYEETDSGGGGVLFPQSDDEDEEISTDGKKEGSEGESYKTSWRMNSH